MTFDNSEVSPELIKLFEDFLKPLTYTSDELMKALRIVCYNKESLKWQRNTKEKVK